MCYIDHCVLCFFKCLMKLKTESKVENVVLQIWFVLLLFECQLSETVTSKDFVCKQTCKCYAVISNY